LRLLEAITCSLYSVEATRQRKKDLAIEELQSSESEYQHKRRLRLDYLKQRLRAEQHSLQMFEDVDAAAHEYWQRFNRTLAERLFGHQYAQEMLLAARGSYDRSIEWVTRLTAVVAALNGEVTRLTGK